MPVTDSELGFAGAFRRHVGAHWAITPSPLIMIFKFKFVRLGMPDQPAGCSDRSSSDRTLRLLRLSPV